MATKITKLSCFVPAKALEHHSNSEFANRTDKIKLALIRFHRTKDFFETADNRPFPFVFLEKINFTHEPLGYIVEASIECG